MERHVDACNSDGVPDATDAFPRNASETVDTDSDGTGNDQDLDGDGIPDKVESGLGLDPLDDAHAIRDAESDLTEYLNGTDPLQPENDPDGDCHFQYATRVSGTAGKETVMPVAEPSATNAGRMATLGA